MREGSAYRVTFGNGSLFDNVVCVVSFQEGDDAVKLARIACESTLPLASIEWLCQASVPE